MSNNKCQKVMNAKKTNANNPGWRNSNELFQLTFISIWYWLFVNHNSTLPFFTFNGLTHLIIVKHNKSA